MSRLIHLETFSTSRLVLEMLEACISDQPDFRVVGQWNRLPHPTVTGPILPDILIASWRNADIPQVTRWTIARTTAFPLLRVLFLTDNRNTNAHLIPHALRSRYTLLATEDLLSTTILFNTIRRVAAVQGSWAQGAEASPISPRQAEILALIAKGYSNQVIAENLHLSKKTVENQINLLYHKLGISQRDPHINARVVATHLASTILPAPRETQGA